MRLLLTGYLTKLLLGIFDITKKVKTDNRVYFPAYFGVIGIVFSLICGMGVFFAVKYEAPVIITVIACGFLLMGLSMITVWINKRIDFDEEGFSYRSFWGIKKRYTYEQISSCWGDGENGYKLFLDNERKISVDKIMCNSAEFFEYANDKHKIYHGGLSVPLGKKKDVFNNNLRNPSDYIAVFVIICLCWAGMLGIGAYGYIDNKNMDESDCEYIASEVIDYRRDENNLILTLKDIEEEVHIDGFYDLAKNQKEFLSLCDKNEKFDAWCRYSDAENSVDPAHYDVAKISHNETVFYSFEEFNGSRQGSMIILWSIVVICTLCMAGLMALFLAVVRNPRKFSPKLVKSLIKPSELVGYEDRNKSNKNSGRKRKKGN